MNKCRECELRRDSKRHRGGGDRLSLLPLPILYHILTFLPTEESVRTSVLSRTWRSVWKYLPILDFDWDNSGSNKTFVTFMKKVLKLRYDFDVEKIIYCFRGTNMKQKEWQDIAINYALSHNAGHLQILCHDTYSQLFGSISRQSFSSLRILVLEEINMDARFCASLFPLLTTLYLRACKFRSGTTQDNQLLDPFSKVPHLRNLTMDGCGCYGDLHQGIQCLRIFGVNLSTLNLIITNPFKLKISAPNLNSLDLQCAWKCLKFSAPLIVPSLVHADISISSNTGKSAANNLITLFQGIRSVESLLLHSTTIETLNMISGNLEAEPSPFHRLKNLVVSSASEDCKPHKAVKSFFKGFL
ncbi:Putative F-box/LRR-repeat protein At5g02930 [Linum grandiflorum]